MTTQHDVSLPVRSFYESLNKRSLSDMVSHVSDQVEFFDIPSGMILRGKEDFSQYWQNWLTGFPAGTGTISHLFSSADTVVIESLGRGTHEGPFYTQAGLIPPSGRNLEIHFCQVFKIQAGKIVSCHSYYDMLTVIRSLGIDTLKKVA